MASQDPFLQSVQAEFSKPAAAPPPAAVAVKPTDVPPPVQARATMPDTPGILSAVKTGARQTLAGWDQLISNLAGGAAKGISATTSAVNSALSTVSPWRVEGGSPFFSSLQTEAGNEAQRRRDQLEQERVSGQDPQTNVEKRVAGVTGALGGAVPYMTTGPVGAGIIGAAQNADQGFVPAVQGAAEGYLGARVGKGLGGRVGKGIEKLPEQLRPATQFGKRILAGGITGGAMGLAGSKGDVSQALNQAFAGALMEAVPQGLPKWARGGGMAGQDTTSAPPVLKKNLPEAKVRSDQLSVATGEGPKVVSDLYQKALPALDATVRMTGKIPTTTDELATTMNDTMGQQETQYQDVLGRIGNQQVSGKPVADAIRKEITPFMLPNGSTKDIYEDAGGMLTDQPTGPRGVKNKLLLKGSEFVGRDLEAAAMQWEKAFELNSLDGHRKYLFKVERDTAAGRIAHRTNAEMISDRAAETALRDLVYGKVQDEATKMGWGTTAIRKLKETQAALYDLLDVIKPQNVKLANKENMDNGTSIFQRSNVTVAGHPGSGTLVGSVHGITRTIAGDPKSRETANERVRKAFPSTAPVVPHFSGAMGASALTAPPPAERPVSEAAKAYSGKAVKQPDTKAAAQAYQ